MPGVPHSTSFTLISFTSSFFAVAISSRYRVHSGKLNFGLLLEHKSFHTWGLTSNQAKPQKFWLWTFPFKKKKHRYERIVYRKWWRHYYSIWGLHYTWPLTFSLCNWVFLLRALSNSRIEAKYTPHSGMYQIQTTSCGVISQQKAYQSTYFEIFLNAMPVSVVETPLADITPACVILCVYETRCG